MVRVISSLAPWLAGGPSAFFIARSSVRHLAAPLWIAWVIGLAVEFLNVSTMHTALDLFRWNTKRAVKRDGGWEHAPVEMAVVAYGVYVVAAVGLSVVLEARPDWAGYAPVVFPALAAAGALTLALSAQHRERMAHYKQDKDKRGLAALLDAWIDARIGVIVRAQGSASTASIALPKRDAPALPASSAKRALVCPDCGREVQGNMGSHVRWHCLARKETEVEV